MKNNTGKNLLLIAALIAFAAVSFGPCIMDAVTYVIKVDGLGDGGYMVDYLPYAPIFVCFVTALELLLVIISNRRWARVLGILLHVFKSAVPFLLYRLRVFEKTGGLFSHEYSLSWLGYILLVISLGALALYICDLKKDRRVSA